MEKKKRDRGRPRVRDADRLSLPISIRLSPNEFERIKAAADRKGLTARGYCRKLILRNVDRILGKLR